MQFDWIVAFAVFISFVAFSIILFTGMIDEPTLDISQNMDLVTGKIADYLKSDTFETPVFFDADYPGQRVLSASINVPDEMESGLFVMDSSKSLSCNLIGDTIYWQADLASGENPFLIAYSDSSSGGCDDSFDISLANKTYPLATLKVGKVTQDSLNTLSSLSYSSFSSSLGIGENINIEWSGPAQGTYGPAPPINSDIYSKELTIPFAGSHESLELKILAWRKQ